MVAMQVVAMLTHPFFGSCDVYVYVCGSQLEQDPQHVTILGSGEHTHSSLISHELFVIFIAYFSFSPPPQTHTPTSPSHPHVHRCRNISVLQSCLSKITLIREKDLDRARQYFEMLYLNDEVCVCVCVCEHMCVSEHTYPCLLFSVCSAST